MRHSVWNVMIALAGCGQLGLPGEARAPGAEQRPVMRPDMPDASMPPAPPPDARTAEQFDTTTPAQRAEAAAATDSQGTTQRLGTTVASLGDPAKPGFWIETPLVSKAGAGRVVFEGRSAAVSLLPIEGPVTAGSRLSLAAMRVIEAPLTALPEVEVFRN